MANSYLITPTPQQQVFALDTDGNYAPANGAKIYTYAAGGTTPVFTYSDHSGTQNTNPIIADAEGRYVAYLLSTQTYKFVITESDGTPIYTQDYINQSSTASGMTPSYTSKTSGYTAVANDFVSCVSGSFTVTLPSASANPNAAIGVVNNGTGTITVGRTGSNTVGLATSQTLNPGATATAQGDEMTFISDGISNWNIT